MKAKGTGKTERASAGTQEERKTALERDGPSPFLVVGIGASAGGLEAFRLLLGELPPQTGMAFVLVQHLAPQHESKLPELLAKDCALPVTEAIEGETVQPDHVYVIPPNADLWLDDGRLRLTPRDPERVPHLPVDHLFRSLAEKQQGRAIGVVLSGTGSDGTLGLCEIKAAGGITFAQESGSAGHAGMPTSAVESGCVDFVLPPAEIARRLIEIGRHPYLAPARAPREEGGQEEVGEAAREEEEGLRRVLAAVRAVRGVDFSQYRDSTIRRRIARRMALHGEESLHAYAERLEADRSEIEALYHDLLINVTSFFRDPEMFEVLKKVVFPAIVKDKQPGEPLRIWVPGCSSGQEAYSLAMALHEYLDTQPGRPTIHIFGTDLSDQAVLEKARAGYYPDSIEAEVSPERLRRFFTKEGHRYRIDRSIRELCVFARQNVAVDPPFSHLDLISCRNLLIYLAPSLHKRVLPTFHYALDVPGFLVLGPAETAGGSGELFELIDRTHKIYSKKPADLRPALHFATEGLRIPANLLGRRRAAAIPSPSDFQREADRLLLGRFAPPAVLVNQSLDVVQFRGRTSPYLEAPPGEPTVSVLSLAREGLFLELRSALAEVARTGNPALRQNVRLMTEGATREITLEVLPVKPSQAEGQCLLIVFHETPREQPPAAGPGAAATDPETEERAAALASRRELESLRQELVGTKEYLESMAEQQDAANEELRSANAEILSTNEELQSTNEELETAKEELQSANEELTTVNEQLQHRNVELSEVNNDLTNLLSSTDIPVVMVSGDLRIRRVTGPARRVMSVLPTDVGRPIGDIRTAVDLHDLEALIRDVIESGQPAQRSVRDRQGRWYELRVMPYRTADNRVAGAVIALVDVDQIRRSQEELLQQAGLLRQQAALIELSHDAIIVRDAADVIQFWNHGAEEMYGYSGDEARGRKLDALLHTDPELWSLVKSTLSSAGSWEGELHQIRSDGTEIIVHSREVVVRDGDGAPATILSIKRDITENKRVLHELKHADRRKDKFLATLAHELRNPIAPIRNAVEIMRLAGNNATVIENVRDMLDRQVRQLAGIVDDLIDISRIVEKKIALHLERVPLDAIVRTAVETARPLIEGAEHELTVELPSEPLLVDADPVRLSQVIVNLLNNAAKFTPPGGRIWLTVEAAPATSVRQRAQAVIRVRDTGVGIPRDQRERIFEMFEQGGELPQQSTSGLGVGLSLARSLVNMHGGTIEVTSAGVDQGTEFILRLPGADLRSPSPSQGARESSAEGGAEARRILVVDDNRDQAQSMGKLLELMGHAVRLAYDGEEALRVARDFLPDVALVDVGLPKMNGFEVARHMRKDKELKHTLLVAQTGWGQEHDRQRTKEAGFDHHLVKPADFGELREILAEPRPQGG